MFGIGHRRNAQTPKNIPRVVETHHEIDITNLRECAVQRHRRAADDPPGLGRVGRCVGNLDQRLFEVGR